jgi:hypothetical protein
MSDGQEQDQEQEEHDQESAVNVLLTTARSIRIENTHIGLSSSDSNDAAGELAQPADREVQRVVGTTGPVDKGTTTIPSPVIPATSSRRLSLQAKEEYRESVLRWVTQGEAEAEAEAGGPTVAPSVSGAGSDGSQAKATVIISNDIHPSEGTATEKHLSKYVEKPIDDSGANPIAGANVDIVASEGGQEAATVTETAAVQPVAGTRASIRSELVLDIVRGISIACANYYQAADSSSASPSIASPASLATLTPVTPASPGSPTRVAVPVIPELPLPVAPLSVVYVEKSVDNDEERVDRIEVDRIEVTDRPHQNISVSVEAFDENNDNNLQ